MSLKFFKKHFFFYRDRCSDNIFLVFNKYLSYLDFWGEGHLFIRLRTKGNITKAVV